MKVKNSEPKPSSFIVSIEMFNFAWLIIANCEWPAAKKLAQRKGHVYGLAAPDDTYDCCWWRTKTDLVDGVIYIPTFKNEPLYISNLVHELVHAVVDMCEYVGVPIDKKSDETAAYAISYLTKTCLRALT